MREHSSHDPLSLPCDGMDSSRRWFESHQSFCLFVYIVKLSFRTVFLAVRLWDCKYIYCKITYLSPPNKSGLRIFQKLYQCWIHIFWNPIMRFVFTSSCLWEDSCLIYIICDRLWIVVSNTYCVVFLLCFSSSCVPYAASFYGLPFLIGPSVLSNVYIFHIILLIPDITVLMYSNN